VLAGVDLDLVAGLYEQRHHDLETGGAILALFITLPEVSPLTAGSVCTTSRTTVVGSSTEMARPS